MSTPRFRLADLPRPVTTAVSIGLFFSLPFLCWCALTPSRLGVLVIDKTVATTTYREHRGLMWALNHLKMQPTEGSAPYRYEEDYAGFRPTDDRKVEVRPIPKRAGAYDMVYFADTYGVYEAEYNLRPVEHPPGRLLYGGLEPADVEQARADLAPHGTLVGEFNMFASPTRGPGRRAAEAELGLRWEGWIGRYFSDLKRGGEVPEWLATGYEHTSGKQYQFRGPGYAYVHEDGRVAVLRSPEEAGKDALRVRFKDPDHFGVLDDTPYGYWYDVVTPKPGTEVLASYHLDVTPQGAALLKQVGIPVDAPAVLRRADGSATRYYLAGDFADYEEVPNRWRLWGMGWIYAHITPPTLDRPEAFFWRVYVPLMDAICRETLQARGVTAGPHTY